MGSPSSPCFLCNPQPASREILPPLTPSVTASPRPLPAAAQLSKVARGCFPGGCSSVLQGSRPHPCPAPARSHRLSSRLPSAGSSLWPAFHLEQSPSPCGHHTTRLTPARVLSDPSRLCDPGPMTCCPLTCPLPSPVNPPAPLPRDLHLRPFVADSRGCWVWIPNVEPQLWPVPSPPCCVTRVQAHSHRGVWGGASGRCSGLAEVTRMSPQK